MSATDVVRFSTTDTAKLIRKTLKAEWPAVKFSVRSKSYSGGCSIDVGWTDGPTAPQVAAILAMYTGASFDGMQDLKTYHDQVAVIDGEPQLVHYSADYVFSHRDRDPLTVGRLEALARVEWRRGRADSRDQCGRCYSPMPERCWYSPSSERLVCSPECWALAEHWHTDYS